VRAAINDLVRETGIATLLTGMMILLFPGSWRSTLIVCVSIPLSILTSLVVLSLCNQTINVMTLFDVYAGNDRRDLGGVANDVYRVVGEVEPKLPPGAFIKVRGQVETMESSFLRLGLGMLFAPRGNCLRKSNRPNWTSRFCRLVPLSPRQKGSSRRPRPISRKRKQRWNSPASHGTGTGSWWSMVRYPTRKEISSRRISAAPLRSSIRSRSASALPNNRPGRDHELERDFVLCPSMRLLLVFHCFKCPADI
jgi:hypothetical protein